MNSQRKMSRKSIIYFLIGITTLALIITGATYAFFQAQKEAGKSSDVKVKTGTTDLLTFNLTDINISDDNVVDENNDDGINANTELVINAEEGNFGPQGSNLGDGVKASATLIANTEMNTAVKQKYNVYLVMDINELIYTQNSSTPELLMYVEQPDGKGELKEILGLKHYDDANGFSGFDITNKANVAFEIAKDYEIEVTADDDGEVVQEWQIKVILLNLEQDQIANAGANLHGQIVITRDTKENTFKLAQVNSLKDVQTTASSITTSLNYDAGTNKIAKYYFGIQEIGPVASISQDENVTWDEPETGPNPSHTFTNLKDNTNYRIYAYIEDEAGFQSNTYNTEIVATDKYNLIEINSAEITATSYDSISVKVNGIKEGTSPLESYKYTIKTNATEVESVVLPKEQTTYTFSKNIQELTQYEIIINAIDANGKESPNYTLSTTTLKKTIGLLCQGKEFSTCFVANYNLDKAVIYHNTANAQQISLPNADKVAGDDSYRYSGSNDIVNNYVCLNSDNTLTGKCDSDDNLFRIIGLFKNDAGKYELKLVKATPASNKELGSNGTAEYPDITNKYFYWNTSIHVDNDFANSCMWAQSNLNTVNLNANYYNYLTNSNTGAAKYLLPLITKHTWGTNAVLGDATGTVITTNGFYYNAKTTYDYELGSNQFKEGQPWCFDNGSSVKRACTKNDLTYPNYIGLLYMSEYGYATLPAYWHNVVVVIATSDTNPVNTYTYDNTNITQNNWLYIGTDEWTMTRYIDYQYNQHSLLDEIDYFCDVEMISNSGADNTGIEEYHSGAIRPTFYLSSTTILKSGDGTKNNPYRIG